MLSKEFENCDSFVLNRVLYYISVNQKIFIRFQYTFFFFFLFNNIKFYTNFNKRALIVKKKKKIDCNCIIEKWFIKKNIKYKNIR